MLQEVKGRLDASFIEKTLFAILYATPLLSSLYSITLNHRTKQSFNKITREDWFMAFV